MNNCFFAEYGTDLHLRQRFFPDFIYKGVMVEVGAGATHLISNSQHFRLNGWRCIGIEPNPVFAKMHRDAGNEIYPYAVSDTDEPKPMTFELRHHSDQYNVGISDESLSSLKIPADLKAADPNFYEGCVSQIMVEVRKLDTVLDIAMNVPQSFDILTVDVEGWELSVMDGMQKYRPKIIVLENLLNKTSYDEYMAKRGYVRSGGVSVNHIYIAS